MNLLIREGKVRVLRSAVLLSLVLAAMFLPAPAAQGIPGGPAPGTAAPDYSLKTLTAEERAWLRDHPVIRMAHDPGWSPIEFTNERGELSGMSGDYLRLVEERLGVKFERVRNLTWQETYARQKRWEIDVATCVAVTPPRLELWAFTEPYLRIPIVIATQANVTYIGDMRELFGKRVALVEGYAIDDWVTKDFPEINLSRVKDPQEGLSLLQRGEVFAYIDNQLIIGDYLAKMRINTIKIAGQTPYVNAQCMAVRKDWVPLAGILQKALESISAKEREDIYRKWLPVRYEQGFNYTLLWQALGVFVAILLVLAYWNRKLAREIRQRQAAEQQLQEQEQRLRLALKGANQGIYDLNVQTGEAQVSPEYATMLGYDPETFRETNAAWIERLHPEDHEPVAAIYRDYVSGRIPEYRIEFRQRAKSGDWKWILSLGKIIQWDAAGQPLRMLGTHTDITERKLAEEALRQSEATYREIFNTVNDAIWVHDIETFDFLDANNKAAEMFGYSIREAVGLTVGDISSNVPPFTQKTAAEYMKKAAAGEPQLFVWHTRHKDGHLFWTEVNLKQGTIAGRECLLAIERDITERKRAEEAMRESEENYRTLIQKIQAAVVVHGPDTSILTCNSMAQELLGLTEDQMLGKTVIDKAWYFFNADGTKMGVEEYPVNQVIARRRALRNFVAGVHRPNKEPENALWVLINADPVFVNDEIVQVIVTFIDISDRRRVEEALRESEKKYQSLFDNAQVALFRTGISDGQLFEINERYAQMAGYANVDDCLAEFNAAEAWADPNARIDLRRILAEKGFVTDYESEIIRRDGNHIWILFSATIFPEQGFIEGSIVDITERKRAEAGLRQANLVVENSPVVLFRWQASEGWPVEMVSRNVIQFGYTPEELLSEAVPFVALVHPDDLERVAREVQEYSAAGADSFQQEYRMVAKDGGVRWVDDRTVVERNVSGQITFYQGIVIDITERKRVEEALRTSEALYHDLVETSQDLIWQCDVEGRYTFLNPAWEQVFGYRVEEMVGKRFSDFQSPEAAARDLQVFAKLMEGGRVKGHETVHLGKAGNAIHLVFNAKFVVDGNGTMLGTRGTAYDITERKRAEEAIKTSEANLNSLIDNRNESIWSLDQDYRFIIFNDFFREAYWSAFQIKLEKGLNALEILTPEQRAFWKPKYDSALAGRNEVFEFSAPLGHEPNYFEVSLNPIWTEGRVAGVSALSINITDRKRAETALLESEALLKKSQAIGHIGSWELDLVAHRLIWSDEVYRIFGLLPGEISASYETFLERVHPEDREAVNAAYARSVREGRETYEIEHRLVRGDNGELRFVQEKCEHVKDATGTIVRSVGLVQDITERRRAEEKRLELSRLLEESLNEIYVFDADTLHFVQVNRGARSNLGYTMTELHSMTPLDLKPDFNQNTFLELIDLLRTGAKPKIIFETKHRRKNSSHYEVEVHLQKGTFEGRPVFVAIIIDLTERKRAEEALRESEERFAAFMRHLPGFAFVKDHDRRVLYVNELFETAFDRPLPEWLGKTNEAVWPGEVGEKIRRDDEAVLAGGRAIAVVEEVPTRGELRTYRTIKFLIPRPDGDPWLGGMSVDITELKQAEAELRASLEEKESLLKEVHHRVKNNLQVISSLLNLQFRQVKNDQVRSFLRDTQNRIRSMAMLHEILYHSDNKARITFPNYVKDLCAQVARSLGSEARKIRLRQEIAPVTLNLDQAVTAGLIINELVTNAFKHAFPSRSEGEILVALQAPDEHHLLLRVSDDGIGFPPESPPPRTESLGLLLVENLSRQLEGRLSVTGRAGTVVEIIFPRNPLER